MAKYKVVIVNYGTSTGITASNLSQLADLHAVYLSDLREAGNRSWGIGYGTAAPINPRPSLLMGCHVIS